MSAVFAYSLVVSTMLMFLYPAVYLTVSRNNRFRFNRTMLISALVISFTVPAIMSANINVHEALPAGAYMVGDATIEKATQALRHTGTAIHIIPLLLGVYYCGIVVLAMKTAYSLFSLAWLKRGCRKELYEGHTLYIHQDKRISPFSFGRAIFISETDRIDAILRHESGHIHANHWVDILMVELTCIFLWYNPFVRLYRNLMKLNHEFEADFHVISGGMGISDYQHLLITKAMGRRTMPLANSFATQGRIFRRRVLLMGKGKTPTARKLSGVLVIPSLVIAVALINHPILANTISGIKNFHNSGIIDTPPIMAIQEAEGTEPAKTILPSPITDQKPLAKTLKYAIMYDNREDAPLNANLRITIDNEGRILNTEISGEYSSEFWIAVNETLTGLTFEPALDNGKPIQITIVLPVKKE